MRNIAAGSLAKRLGLAEGTKMKKTVLEFCYKDDELGDPMVNEYHILAMEYCTEEALKRISQYAVSYTHLYKGLSSVYVFTNDASLAGLVRAAQKAADAIGSADRAVDVRLTGAIPRNIHAIAQLPMDVPGTLSLIHIYGSTRRTESGLQPAPLRRIVQLRR